MTEEQIGKLAGICDDAAMNTAEIVMLTAEHPDMTMEDAYSIQEASVQKRTERGDELIGMKMGLTSRAKMEQMGVHEPIYGRLTQSMVVDDGGTIRLGDYCHPRVEPEVAFLLADDLEGPVTIPQALAAVGGVCAALEIIDSRYRDFKFTLPDVVADNTSASGFVLGNVVVPGDEIDLGNLGIVMEVNGQVVQTGSSAAIYEHPLRSLVELAGMMSRRGQGLKAGQIVLAGGATAAVALNAGDYVRVSVDMLGTAEFRVAE